MCDVKDPCCVLSPIAGKIACEAKGGTLNSDPCNVLNPLSTPSACNAKTATTAATTPGNHSVLTFVIVAVVVLIGVPILFMIVIAVFGGGSVVFDKVKGMIKRTPSATTTPATDVVPGAAMIQGGLRKLRKLLRG